MVWVPEACTLPTAEQPLRLAEFDELFATAVRPAERTGATALVVHLPPGAGTATAAAGLIARESACCSFFSFSLRVASARTELVVRVPVARTAVLDAVQQRAEAARTRRAGS